MDFPTDVAARGNLLPMQAGLFHQWGSERYGFHCGFSNKGPGFITKTTEDDNGINLHLTYADGSTEVRNVNPRMNVFTAWKKPA